MDKLPIALQLKAIREKADVSIRTMAERVGKPASSYAHYENPKNFKAEFLPLNLARSFADALRPEGFSDDVMRLAGVGDEIAPEGNEVAIVQAGEGHPDEKKLVAVYDVSASAGFGSLPGTEELSAYSLAFPPNYLRKLTRSNPENLSIISVKGDSMEPTLHDDDIVMLDFSKRDLNFDGLFVLRFGETLHVKRVARSAKREHVKIISDNREVYPPEDMHLRDVEVVGKVLWKAGKV
jgi:transcriptional regulator with XRE-family HTH domain